MIKFYGYDKCSTCRKAEKALKEGQVEYQKFDITENPPSKALLQKILKTGDYELKHLFNTSGVMYREMKIKDKLPDMSQTEALDLLAKNGKLIKRPVVSNGSDLHTVGYKPENFEKNWL